MGMQCEFERDDLPEDAQVSRGPDEVPDNWYIDAFGKRLEAWSEDGESFWFDVGSESEWSMRQLATLIGWRTNYTCS